MPILRANIDINNTSRKVRVLIDSEAAINLVSKEIATELEKNGLKISREGNMRIKVANGGKALVDKVLEFPIFIGGVRTDPIKFFILENLPFDILIGNPTLEDWEAVLSWRTKVFSLQPVKNSKERFQTNWKTFHGQHWRKPVALLLKVKTILKPYSQN